MIVNGEQIPILEVPSAHSFGLKVRVKRKSVPLQRIERRSSSP